jgi:hypothetical protein
VRDPLAPEQLGTVVMPEVVLYLGRFSWSSTARGCAGKLTLLRLRNSGSDRLPLFVGHRPSPTSPHLPFSLTQQPRRE